SLGRASPARRRGPRMDAPQDRRMEDGARGDRAITHDRSRRPRPLRFRPLAPRDSRAPTPSRRSSDGARRPAGARRRGGLVSGPRLGAHMSVAGGMARAVERARAVEATALQVFVKTPNQWAARALGPGEAVDYRKAASDAGLAEHTLAHASYL